MKISKMVKESTEKLKQSYKYQIIRAGVDSQKAEQAVQKLTLEELQLILEIWPEWATTFAQTEKELNLLPLSVSRELSELINIMVEGT